MHLLTEINVREPLKCYCGFAAETERDLKDHIVKTHGARDGDWKGWVSRD